MIKYIKKIYINSIFSYIIDIRQSTIDTTTKSKIDKATELYEKIIEDYKVSIEDKSKIEELISIIDSTKGFSKNTIFNEIKFSINNALENGKTFKISEDRELDIFVNLLKKLKIVSTNLDINNLKNEVRKGLEYGQDSEEFVITRLKDTNNLIISFGSDTWFSDYDSFLSIDIETGIIKKVKSDLINLDEHNIDFVAKSKNLLKREEIKNKRKEAENNEIVVSFSDGSTITREELEKNWIVTKDSYTGKNVYSNKFTGEVRGLAQSVINTKKIANIDNSSEENLEKITIKVKSGDTLEKYISKYLSNLGKDEGITLIRKYNPNISDSLRVYPGETIIIPRSV